jgi:hypothetical protein
MEGLTLMRMMLRQYSKPPEQQSAQMTTPPITRISYLCFDVSQQ